MTIEIHATIKATAYIEPFGKAFMRMCKRSESKRTITEDEELEEAFQEALQSDSVNDDNSGYDDFETPALLKSDPLNWKKQDHYAVLGLLLRYKANDDDIKRAYRKKVLKHHPDKTASANKILKKKNTDSFFKCIQKAWEVLSDSTKRRQWDSCDPKFSDAIPSLKATGDFFEVYGACFEKEARFCLNPPCPSFGNAESTRNEVELFYNFWFKFESWRSFEMMDEEDVDKAENRDEKRYYDKLNKSSRQKRKKEDNSRLIKFVEQSFKNDPRLLKFKKDEKEAKELKKKEKADLAQKVIDDAKQAIIDDQLAKLALISSEKEQGQAAKKAKDAAKKALKKLQKSVAQIVQSANYYLENISNAQFAEQVGLLTRLIDSFGDDFNLLTAFKLDLESGGKMVYENKCNEFGIFLEIKKHPESIEKDCVINDRHDSFPEWIAKDIALLFKVAAKHPGGTVNRWSVIAEYISLHTDTKRTWQDCIEKYGKGSGIQQIGGGGLQVGAMNQGWETKNMKEPGDLGSFRDWGEHQSYQTIELAIKKEESFEDNEEGHTIQVEERVIEAVKDTGLQDDDHKAIKIDVEWTKEQLLQLATALKTFPPQLYTSDPTKRWDDVAEAVDGKSKKQVKTQVTLAASLRKQT